MNATKKLRTAMLSYGLSGKIFHAPFLEIHPGFELTGVWERSNKKVQDDFPLVKSYPTFESLLADDPELVIVNTPVATHFEYAKKAILAKKHVLVEKAFTATLDEAEELRELADEKGVVLSVFHNRRWDSDFKTVRDVFEKNILGDIIEAEIHFDRYNPELSVKSHKESANPGAGILKDLGPHIIDQALVLFGFPDALHADIRTTRENSAVDDWFDITLHYDKARVRLKAGYFVREALPAYIFHGTKGSFIKSRGDVQEEHLREGKTPMVTDWGIEPVYKSGLLHTEIEGSEVRENIPTLHGNYYGFFDSLYNALRGRGENPVTADDGVNVMRIIEKAVLSSELNKTIRF